MEQRLILLIGGCGSGKTWVMKQLLSLLKINPQVYSYQAGLYRYALKNGVAVLGKYDGSTFEGSDKLAMNIMSSNDEIAPVIASNIVICEGDRFTNKTFIERFNPLIIKITDDGAAGRARRNSQQTERQIKSITTRVAGINAAIELDNSEQALEFILNHVKVLQG